MVYRVQVTAVEPSGELNVGLCYNDHTQRLIVSIVEARHLKAASLDNHSPGFCTARLYLQALLQWVGKRVRRTSIYHFRQGGNVFKPCSDGIHYTDVRFMTHDCSWMLWKQDQCKLMWFKYIIYTKFITSTKCLPNWKNQRRIQSLAGIKKQQQDLEINDVNWTCHPH